MQIPSNSEDIFINLMAKKSESIRSLFVRHMEHHTKKIPLKVMLGNGTVTDQVSFDPSLVGKFYEELLKKLPHWSNNGVETSSDQDLRRIFIKFSIRQGNYLLTANMSLQYHVLLFYKLDHKVLEIQKELADISTKLEVLREKIKPDIDKKIEEKLKEMGHENMDHQKLFEIMFQNDDLTEELVKSFESREYEINELATRQGILLKELDNLLLEVYQTNPVMIGETQMIAAEEGCLCNFNMDHIKNNSKEGIFNTSRITSKVKDSFLKSLDDIIKAMDF